MCPDSPHLNASKMSQRPLNDPKYHHPHSSHFHLDNGLETQSDCSPHGSILLATSDDDLLPTSSLGPQKSIPHTYRPRTVRFADKPPLTSASPPSSYNALSKSGKAKKIAKTTLHGVGTVAGVALGCVCFVFTKACVYDGGAGLSGGGSRVVSARPGEKALSQRRIRVVEMNMTGYAGYHGDTKRRPAVARAGVPRHVRVAQPTVPEAATMDPLRQLDPYDAVIGHPKQSFTSASS